MKLYININFYHGCLKLVSISFLFFFFLFLFKSYIYSAKYCFEHIFLKLKLTSIYNQVNSRFISNFKDTAVIALLRQNSLPPARPAVHLMRDDTLHFSMTESKEFQLFFLLVPLYFYFPADSVYGLDE